ncbi:nitroreductase family protein [Prauserella cavernicola]|uniref:Nitroreductase family protein n=1 Tax=Prauserella cavernicola TaxID=2800127 RepID=A0A934QMP0_9PSEU|nr:nitroreductase family protein [Prauserella cavernicola]MBK1783200.1 nitroreductase family protein [Prauserella cavernicola]
MTDTGLITSLRATRFFLDRPVEEAELDAIVDVARWTGSARNRQPWRFVAVTDGAVRAELARHGRYAQVLAVAPAVLVLLSDPGAGEDTEFDLGRVCQSVLLAAHARGLGSCPVTVHPEENARRAARLVGAPPPWRAGHAVALGHPAPTPRGRSAIPTGRKPLTELLTHHRPGSD